MKANTMRSLSLSLFLFALGVGAHAAAAIDIPPENQQQGTPAAVQAFDGKAQRLLDVFASGEVSAADDIFFPREVFKELKAIAKPDAYYQELMKRYRADLMAEHQKAKGTPLTFVSFKLGSCKWKAKGTEANSIPYWSCYRSKIKVKAGEGPAAKTSDIEIRTLINWGKDWYITHLHPM